MNISIKVAHPTVPAPNDLDDTWVWDTPGIIVAKSGASCPVWGDVLPYKSVTVIVQKELEQEARYSLEYVHGGKSVSKRKKLSGDRVALRSNYKCW